MYDDTICFDIVDDSITVPITDEIVVRVRELVDCMYNLTPVRIANFNYDYTDTKNTVLVHYVVQYSLSFTKENDIAAQFTLRKANLVISIRNKIKYFNFGSELLYCQR